MQSGGPKGPPSSLTSDLPEIAPKRGQTILVPFTRAVVPDVDLAAGRVIIDPPEGLLTGDQEGTAGSI